MNGPAATLPPGLSEPERARLAVLAAVAGRSDLFEAYVLKGGLALQYAYGSPRRSHDLDFSATATYPRAVTSETTAVLFAFSDALDEALLEAAPAFGFPSMRTCWRETTEELPVLLARIGYGGAALEGLYAQYAEMQVTLSETVLETRRTEIYGIPLHVPTLEGIIAEKLKAYLQQAPRDTSRPRDLFDLWYYVSQSDRPLDSARVGTFLLTKAENWPEIQPVTRARFRDPELKARSARAFEAVGQDLNPPAQLPPFEGAHRAVMRFVEGLPLDEG